MDCMYTSCQDVLEVYALLLLVPGRHTCQITSVQSVHFLCPLLGLQPWFSSGLPKVRDLLPGTGGGPAASSDNEILPWMGDDACMDGLCFSLA